MTQQKSGSQEGYGRGGAETTMHRPRDMADVTGEKVKEVAAGAQEMTGKVVEQAREYGEQARDAAKQIKPFVERSLKERPMATLAGAAVLGFVLGALWRR